MCHFHVRHQHILLMFRNDLRFIFLIVPIGSQHSFLKLTNDLQKDVVEIFQDTQYDKYPGGHKA